MSLGGPHHFTVWRLLLKENTVLGYGHARSENGQQLDALSASIHPSHSHAGDRFRSNMVPYSTHHTHMRAWYTRDFVDLLYTLRIPLLFLVLSLSSHFLSNCSFHRFVINERWRSSSPASPSPSSDRRATRLVVSDKPTDLEEAHSSLRLVSSPRTGCVMSKSRAMSSDSVSVGKSSHVSRHVDQHLYSRRQQF